MASIIRITKEKGDIIIRASIKDLAFLAENHPEYPFKVLDMEAFGKEVLEELKTYSTQNEVEKGSTHAEELFENILEQVGESGSDSVEIIELD